MLELFVNIATEYVNNDDIQFLKLQNLNVELYLSSEDMDGDAKVNIEEVTNIIKNNDFKVTVHAPFYDLNLGAYDKKIRKLSEDRVLWALYKAKELNARAVIVHPGYGTNSLGLNFDKWLERAKESISIITNKAIELQLQLAFENVFDNSPNELLKLLKEFNSDNIGICFDIGHFNLFSTVGIKSWLESFGEKIIEIHLHDNHGISDDHIAIGDGNIKFEPIIEWYKKVIKKPILTLELTQKTHIIKSVNLIRKILQ